VVGFVYDDEVVVELGDDVTIASQACGRERGNDTGKLAPGSIPCQPELFIRIGYKVAQAELLPQLFAPL
jgi:hypothetical protein